MTKNEVKKFEEDWFNMWNPVILSLLENQISFLGQFP